MSVTQVDLLPQVRFLLEDDPGLGKNLYPLRKVLELIQNTNVRVTLKLHGETGELAKKKLECPDMDGAKVTISGGLRYGSPGGAELTGKEGADSRGW